MFLKPSFECCTSSPQDTNIRKQKKHTKCNGNNHPQLSTNPVRTCSKHYFRFDIHQASPNVICTSAWTSNTGVTSNGAQTNYIRPAEPPVTIISQPTLQCHAQCTALHGPTNYSAHVCRQNMWASNDMQGVSCVALGLHLKLRGFQLRQEPHGAWPLICRSSRPVGARNVQDGGRSADRW